MGKRRIKLIGKAPPAMRTTRSINAGTRMRCIDNSGAKMVEIIAVLGGWKGIRRRRPAATIGDMVLVTVKDGAPDVRKKMAKAIITSITKEFKRPSGEVIKFAENTCILVDDEGNPRGSESKGAIAKEAIERWGGLGKIATIVV